MLSTGGDNTFRTQALTNPQFVYGIEFVFTSSGAIDNIVLETVENTADIPAPASLPVLLVGLVGIKLISRRKKSAATTAKT